MQWIKANERLPEVFPDESKSFYCRHIKDGDKKILWYGKSSQSFLASEPWNWEWLDESPTPVLQEDVNTVADEYVKKQGSHDRPDITRHDFIQGFLAGAAHGQQGSHPDRLTIDGCIEWLKELYEKIQHPDPDYESVDEVMVLDTIEILKKVRNKRLPSNIVELLKEANPWKEDVASASFRGGYNRCVSKLRELIKNQPPQGNAEDQDDDDELEDKIVNIMCESIEQDSDYSLRGTEEAARKIIKLFKNK